MDIWIYYSSILLKFNKKLNIAEGFCYMWLLLDETVKGGGGGVVPICFLFFFNFLIVNVRQICYNYGRQKTLEQMVDSLLLVYSVEFHSARAASGEWFIATAAVGFSSEAVR